MYPPLHCIGSPHLCAHQNIENSLPFLSQIEKLRSTVRVSGMHEHQKGHPVCPQVVSFLLLNEILSYGQDLLNISAHQKINSWLRSCPQLIVSWIQSRQYM